VFLAFHRDHPVDSPFHRLLYFPVNLQLLGGFAVSPGTTRGRVQYPLSPFLEGASWRPPLLRGSRSNWHDSLTRRLLGGMVFFSPCFPLRFFQPYSVLLFDSDFLLRDDQQPESRHSYCLPLFPPLPGLKMPLLHAIF